MEIIKEEMTDISAIRESFEKVAKYYALVNDLPFGRHIIESTLCDFFLDNGVKGKRVLDLGCGDGYHCRLMKKMGALTVIGVDISPKMIKMAKGFERILNQKIDYYIDDIRVPMFDQPASHYVLLVFVLDQARCIQELRNLCQVVFEQLEPDGMLIIITTMVPPDPKICSYNFRNHGMVINVTSVENKCKLIGEYRIYVSQDLDILSEAVPMTIYSKETYKSILKKAGFKEITIMPLKVSSICPESLGADFWKELLESNLFYSVVCKKKAAKTCSSSLNDDLEDSSESGEESIEQSKGSGEQCIEQSKESGEQCIEQSKGSSEQCIEESKGSGEQYDKSSSISDYLSTPPEGSIKQCIEQSQGSSEQSQGSSEQSQGSSEQSQGSSEQSNGCSEQYDGSDEQSKGSSEESKSPSKRLRRSSEQAEAYN